MIRYLLALAAIVAFFIAALLAFGWFGATVNEPHAIGFGFLGLVPLTVALVLPNRVVTA